MPKDNVTQIKSNLVPLAAVKKALDAWRATKQKPNEKIPQDLWEQILPLLKVSSEREVCSALHLTPMQMARGKQLFQVCNEAEEIVASPPMEPIDFCEAKEQASYPLAYKPAEAFATNTSIVELRRPDGMLMKIHICTDRFEELLRAFFKG